MKATCLSARIQRIVIFAAVALLACAAVVNAAEEKQDDRWRFTIIPYLWLPSVTGSMKLKLPYGYGSGSTDISSSDYLDNLSFAGMLDVQVQKGRWSILADVMYVDFSDDNRSAYFPGISPASGGWAVSADTELQALIFEVAGGYTVFRNEFMNFDLLAGLRYAGIDGKASLDIIGPPPVGVLSPTFKDSKSYIDPIIGFRGRFEFAKRWFIPYYFDAGGLDSNFTLQAFAGIGYQFCDWFSMVLGYRYLHYNFDDNKLVEDASLSGGQLGFVFSF
jgi:opacity protein-like surface antigen